MKKNKFTFLVATSFLAVSALVGCNKSEEPSGGNSAAISSDALVSSDIINASSNNLGSSVIPDSSSSNPSSASSDPISGSSDGGASSSSSSSSSSSGGGEQEVKTDWTDDEKGVMRSHLYGLVLPFVASDVTASYSADSNTVLLEGRNSMSDTFLAGYAANFTTANGWEGGDISEQMNYYAGTAYAYQKAVTQNGVKRYVVIYFTGLIEHEDGPQTYGKTGKFYLEAVDPYLYEYPAAMIEQWLDMVYDTSIVPPSFEADYYNADTAGLLLGRSDNNIEDAYKAKLDADVNFTVDANKNENGFYVAHPSDASYVLLFKYDATNKMMMLKVEAPRGWNADIINAFLTKYNCQGLVIPSISDPNIGFRFKTSEETAGREGGIVTVTDISLQAAQAYVDSMKTAGYLLDDDQVVYDGTIWSSVGYLVTDYGTYSVMVTYDEVDNLGRLMIIFGASRDTTRVKSWPAASIAALLSATQDSVPAFTGDNQGFVFLSDARCVFIYLPSGTEENAKTAYIQKLLDDHYVDNGSAGGTQSYRSQHNEIVVSVVPTSSSGMSFLAIYFQDFDRTEWPAQAIAAAIVSNVSGGQSMTDTIPALNVDLAELCTVNTNYSDEFEICIDGLGSSLADFKKVFTDNGWVNAAYYEYDGPSHKGVLVSPNRQLMAYFSTYGEGKNISIFVSKYYARDLKVVGTFSNVDKWDFNYSEISFVDSTDPEEVAKDMYQTQLLAQFDVVAGDKFKVSNGVEWYGYEDIPQADRPNESDFTIDDDKNIVATKDGTVKLFLKELSDGSRKIYVCYKPELVPWPSNQIKAVLDAWGVSDEIPALQDECITDINFEYNDVDEYFTIVVVGGASLADRYETLLEADYEFDNGDGLWFPDSNKISVSCGPYNGDLYIGVGLKQAATVNPWPGENLENFFGDQWTFPEFDFDGKQASYNNYAESDDPSKSVTMTVTMDTDNIGSELDGAIDILRDIYGYGAVNNGGVCVLTANNMPTYTITSVTTNSFVLTITVPVVEPAFKVVGLGDDWDYESDGHTELAEVLEPGEGISKQYTASFRVDMGDEFKITNGSSWYGFDSDNINANFGTNSDGNYVAKYSGVVDLTFSILENGTYSIVISFEADDEQPTEVTYKIVCDDDSWDNLIAGGAKFYAWVWGGNYGENGHWVELEINSEKHCFYLRDIDATAEHYIIARMNPSYEIEPSTWNNDAIWNKTDGNSDFPEVGLILHVDILP